MHGILLLAILTVKSTYSRKIEIPLEDSDDVPDTLQWWFGERGCWASPHLCVGPRHPHLSGCKFPSNVVWFRGLKSKTSLPFGNLMTGTIGPNLHPSRRVTALCLINEVIAELMLARDFTGFATQLLGKIRNSLLQLRVFRFGLLEDGDVGVGVFPEGRCDHFESVKDVIGRSA
jgi:hypothetical protein